MTDLFSQEAASRTGIFPGEDVWTVSEIAATVKAMLEDGLPPFWLRGEVCEFRAYNSGHWYFSLKDAAAQIRCCMWKSSNVRVGKAPVQGTEVYALMRPDFYAKRGELQFVVLTLIPTAAVGQQHLELERIRAALQADGLFDAARKRSLPPYPGTVALVTSRDGAALRDLLTVARRRWPCARVLLVPTRVQGAEAEGELVRALGVVNRLDEVNLCIVGRGGGSKDDLAVFNSEAVCRALAQVRVPTISAVGHETDISLTDLVADVRAPTPSAAMELAVPDIREVLRTVADLSARLAVGLGRRTELAAERLERSAHRLDASMRHHLERARARADRLGAALHALSPLQVLQRGYAMPVGGDGRVLKRRAEFVPGMPFTLRVSDGDVAARVESSE